MRLSLLLLVLLLPACAPAGVMATAPIYEVEIDGVRHQVQEMPGTKNAWGAQPANLWGGLVDPADYARNIQAIEKHTGCNVVSGTVTNQGLQTTALVKC